MRKFLRGRHVKFCVYAGAAIAATASSGTAFAGPSNNVIPPSVTSFDIDPPSTAIVMGSGYNSVTGNWTSTPCVTMPSKTVASYSNGDSSPGGSDWSIANTRNDVASAVGLSVSASFSASMGFASVSASDKLSTVNTSKTSDFTQTVVASWFYYDAPQIVDPSQTPMLKEPAKYSTYEDFRTQCGDFFVVGVQQGRSMYGTLNLSVEDTESANSLQNDAGLSFKGGFFSGKVDVNNLEKVQQKSSSTSQQISVSCTGGGGCPSVQNLKDFAAAFKAFPSKSPGDKRPVKVYLQRYDDASVGNLPMAQWALAQFDQGESPTQQLIDLAQVAWNLQELMDDANYVLAHSKAQLPAMRHEQNNLYALGTTTARRTAELAYVHALLQKYTNDLSELQNAVKNTKCTPSNWPQACDAIHTKWTAMDLEGEFEKLPYRYIADCYVNTNISGAGQLFLPSNNPIGMKLSGPTAGDAQFSGHRVWLDGNVFFRPDVAAGVHSLDEVRNLRGILDLNMKEDVSDWTTYTAHFDQPVLNLATWPPDSSGQPSRNPQFSQCLFHGTGLKIETVAHDSHGFIHDSSGIQANGFTTYKGVGDGASFNPATKGGTKPGHGGILDTMSCQTGNNSNQDNMFVSCNALGMRDVQLDLVDMEDVTADSNPPPASAQSAARAHADKNHPATHKALEHFVRAQHPAPSCPANTVARKMSLGVVCLPKYTKKIASR